MSWRLNLEGERHLHAEESLGVLLGGLEGNDIASSWGNRRHVQLVSNAQVTRGLRALEIRGEGADISILVDDIKSIHSDRQLELSRGNLIGQVSRSSDDDIVSSDWGPGSDIQSRGREISSSAGLEWYTGKDHVGHEVVLLESGDLNRARDGRGNSQQSSSDSGEEFHDGNVKIGWSD